MKKVLSALTIFAVMITLVLGMTLEVAAASGSLSGPDSVKQGSTFTVSYEISTTECQGINASYSFNTSELTLNSVKDNNGADVSFKNGSLFLNTETPVSGTKSILNFSFTATGAIGAKPTISLSGISITENYTEVPMSNVSHTVTIAESTTYPSSSAAPSSSETKQPDKAPETVTSTASGSSKTAATSANTSKQKTANSSSQAAISSNVSSVVSEVTSSQETVSSEISKVENDTEKDTDKGEKNNKAWIIVAISGFVLGGSIGALIYIKRKKPEES